MTAVLLTTSEVVSSYAERSISDLTDTTIGDLRLGVEADVSTSRAELSAGATTSLDGTTVTSGVTVTDPALSLDVGSVLIEGFTADSIVSTSRASLVVISNMVLTDDGITSSVETTEGDSIVREDHVTDDDQGSP